MTMAQIHFLLPAFVMCLVLVGIHCYLGIHVLARQVLFIDLALAQVAALGTTIAYYFGYEHADPKAFWISLGFTLGAALLFTLAGRLKKTFSVEALIGIVYAFSSAVIVLVIDQLSHGAEHLKQTLVGQILWTSWSDVVKVVSIYTGVALIHFFFRRPLIQSSFSGRTHWVWDFLFYALFGVVITCSVQISGVLLVFAFLIVPAALSGLFATQLSLRLFIGWGLGFALCSIGLFLAVKYDWPPGASIVSIFTLTPILYVLVAGLKNLVRV